MIIETARLRLRRLTAEDAEFILRLLNEPSFLEHIGDRGVRTLDDARAYIQNGPIASYESNGFGLYLVEEKEIGCPIGMCGLLKREALQDVDIGYALVPEFWSKGYASEAASAVISFASVELGRRRILALTSLDNHGSIHVLEKLGFRLEGQVRLTKDSGTSKLFSLETACKYATEAADHRLVRPLSKDEWETYHSIRRSVLWEARGAEKDYDANHPDERAANNHPFVLFFGSDPVGAVRVDLDSNGHEAVFRKVAIVAKHQRQGHGSSLMRLVEDFAVRNGCPRFVVNVARDAIGFYSKLGYRLEKPLDEERDSPRMVRKYRERN
jgi:RimJ/RimL family protein N-acetyltransferase